MNIMNEIIIEIAGFSKERSRRLFEAAKVFLDKQVALSNMSRYACDVDIGNDIPYTPERGVVAHRRIECAYMLYNVALKNFEIIAGGNMEIMQIAIQAVKSNEAEKMQENQSKS